MNKDKQIEEMAKQLYGNFGLSMPTARNIAKYLTDKKGYRKASDVAREIFAEIGKVIRKWGAVAEQDNSDYAELTELILSDIATSIAELKKKYTEGGENE